MSAGIPFFTSQKLKLYGVRTKIVGYFFELSFGRYTSAAMRFPSRIGTISLRSIMAMDSSCRSVVSLLFTNSGSGGVLVAARAANARGGDGRGWCDRLPLWALADARPALAA